MLDSEFYHVENNGNIRTAAIVKDKAALLATSKEQKKNLCYVPLK